MRHNLIVFLAHFFDSIPMQSRVLVCFWVNTATLFSSLPRKQAFHGQKAFKPSSFAQSQQIHIKAHCSLGKFTMFFRLFAQKSISKIQLSKISGTKSLSSKTTPRPVSHTPPVGLPSLSSLTAFLPPETVHLKTPRIPSS